MVFFSTHKEIKNMAKFVSLYDRFRCFCGDKAIQFEGKKFNTEVVAEIEFLRKHKYVTEIPTVEEPKSIKAKSKE
jgi:hypothetical protein